MFSNCNCQPRSLENHALILPSRKAYSCTVRAHRSTASLPECNSMTRSSNVTSISARTNDRLGSERTKRQSKFQQNSNVHLSTRFTTKQSLSKPQHICVRVRIPPRGAHLKGSCCAGEQHSIPPQHPPHPSAAAALQLPRRNRQPPRPICSLHTCTQASTHMHACTHARMHA